MTIPIQILNNNSNNQYGIKMHNIINTTPKESCGFGGNLPSWEFGLTPEYKRHMQYQFDNIGKLAQLDTVNSPYYTNVTIDPNYLNFIHCIRRNNK